MITDSKTSGLWSLHSAVILFALSGLFGKWLSLSPTFIVFGRAFFAAITLFIFILFIKRQSIKITKAFTGAMLLTGTVLAFHWVTFFHAIQVSNVAIGLITFASFPVFVSFLEPLFFKEKFHWKSLIQALLTTVGVIFVLPQTPDDSGLVYQGALSGIASALLFAVLTILNRHYVRNASAKLVALYQNLFAAIVLAPLLVFNSESVSSEALMILVLLGVVFTAGAHSLFNYSLKMVNARTASMAVSLEPIYAILAAWFLLDESLTVLMCFGGLIVVFVNVWATVRPSS